MDLTIVSLVGITTRWAESIVRYYELMTAPSYIHIRRCSHASLLARSSMYMTTREHMLAHMPLYSSKLIVSITSCSANPLQPVQTKANNCKQEQNMNRT